MRPMARLWEGAEEHGATTLGAWDIGEVLRGGYAQYIYATMWH